MSDPKTDNLADRSFSARPVYLTDLDQCRPETALSERTGRGRWRTLGYQTESISGTMLLAGPETGAREITYPLRVTGWHAVSLGVLGDARTEIELRVRASGERTFSILRFPPTHSHGGRQIQELFWRVADLTGQDLVLAQSSLRLTSGDSAGSVQSITARIAYIKLVPLSAEETSDLRADRERSDTRLLFAHNDAHGTHFGYRPTTEDDIRPHVELYRDTDFSRLYWEAGGGDLLFYFSKIGAIPTYDALDDFDRVGDRMQAESWRILRESGVDPFRVALDHAHEIGLEFHASYRVAGFHYPPPLDHFNSGPSFYDHHPELRGIDRNGSPTPRISYTYPEARRFVLSLFREMAGYPIDGIALLYNRRPPLVEFEPALVQGFRDEYGQDPRELPENDPRWLSYRAGTLTQFMREVRLELDAVSREQGRSRRIEVSAVVMSGEAENMLNGMDLKAWVDEGLVDTLIPYTSALNLDSDAEAWTDVTALQWFQSLTEGTPCILAPNIMPRQMSPEAFRRRAAYLYEGGVENMFFWDAAPQQGRVDHSGSWNVLRRLGHRDEVDAWVRSGEPGLTAPSMALTRLGDWDLSYATPG